MKKYNKPEIATLALDVVDVIETSGAQAAMLKLQEDSSAYAGVASAQVVTEQIQSMSTTWSW